MPCERVRSVNSHPLRQNTLLDPLQEPLLVSDKKAAMLERLISPSKSFSRANSGERRASATNLIKAIH